MASVLNDTMLQFFEDHYQPGVVGVVGTRDLIGMAIREAQHTVTLDARVGYTNPEAWVF